MLPATSVANAGNPDSWVDFKNFIDVFGSHVITGYRTGARMQYYAIASTSSSYTVSQMRAKLCAKYVGGGAEGT